MSITSVLSNKRIWWVEQGHVLDVLDGIPDKSVQMIVTSPPYFNLRSYETETLVWGGDEDCEHEWSNYTKPGNTWGTPNKNVPGLIHKSADTNTSLVGPQEQAVCVKCGAWRGDLGNETLHDCNGWATGDRCGTCFICNMTRIFMEIWRVLRDDGVCFINIGDSYAQSGGSGSGEYQKRHKQFGKVIDQGTAQKPRTAPNGLKPKDLCGVPWRLAFSLQAEGWHVRNDIVWDKNALPECLDPKTKVFVRQDGWVSRVQIERLVKMDRLPEILSPNGWVKINNIWKVVKPAISIEAGKVERVICSPEHRFPISSDRRVKKVRLEEADNIRHQGYADYLLYCPIDRFLVPSVKVWSGMEMGCEMGYFLGVYAAEGCIERGFSVKLTVGSHEHEFMENIRSSLNSLGVDWREGNDRNSFNFTVCSEWLYRLVNDFVTGEAKTKSLNMEVILNSPLEFREGLLNGYIDGDGHRRNGWSAASASRRLRDDIATLASSVGIITSKIKTDSYDNRTEKTYRAYSVYTPYMTRRKQKSGMPGVYQVPPRSRKHLSGEREMFEIEVEGGLFIIGDGLVTHNSTKDRCSKTHEYIFMLTKKPNYYFDQEAIREPYHPDSVQRKRYPTSKLGAEPGQTRVKGGKGSLGGGVNTQLTPNASGANKTTIWRITNEPSNWDYCYGCKSLFIGAERKRIKKHKTDDGHGNELTIRECPGCGSREYWVGHYASFPVALPGTCIKAGSSHKTCSACGAPYERVLEPSEEYAKYLGKGYHDHSNDKVRGMLQERPPSMNAEYVTVGWRPTCKCNAPAGGPSVVLDPFSGTARSGLAALRLGRRYIGIELSEKYAEVSRRLIEEDMPLFNMVTQGDR